MHGPGAVAYDDEVAARAELFRSQSRFAARFVAVVVVAVGALWWITASHRADRGRQGATHQLIDSLSQAAKMYERDHHAYPSGDGNGSAGLARALSVAGPKRLAYFELRDTMLDAEGHIVSYLRPSDRLNYRCPGVHNPASFDLWCRDATGREDGCNNWE